jgi:hypothetical protein
MSQTVDALEALIRFFMRDVTYHKHYTCTVQGQVGDELDVVPDDPTIQAQGLSRVPISYGLPGVSAQVAPGTKVTLFFENGDPEKPRICNWDGGHITLSFADGVMPMARVGDQIAGSVVVASGSSAGTYPFTGFITGGAPTVTG